ncbi:MAG: phosphoribosyltransferase family protein [Pseudomonadota bacterium]
MTNNNAAALEAAKIVVEAGAVYTRTSGDPFFFSSGWASPVFIDLKRLISFADARQRLIELALQKIDEVYQPGTFDLIAGCELAGVPFASMIADRRHLPLVVAMKRARGFGRMSQFEGTFQPRTRTLLVDDLTTDGRTKESIKQALKAAQAEVVGVFVLLDYGIFPEASDMTSLMSLADIVTAAKQGDHSSANDLRVIEEFLSDAPRWSRRNGGIETI